MSLNIKQRLAMYFIVCIILISISIGTVSIVKSAEQMQEQNNRIISYVTSEVHGMISRSIGSGVKDLDLIADSLEGREIDDEMLKEIQRTHWVYEDIILVDSYGDVIASSFYKYSGQFRESEATKAALKGGIGVSGVHYVYPPLRTVITFAKPIPENISGGERIVAIQLNTDYIFAILDEFIVGKTGFAFVLDENYNIIHHPDKERLFNKAPDLLVSQIEGEADNVMFEERGKVYVGRYYSDIISEVSDKKWTVVAVIERDEYRYTLYSILTQILIGILIFIIIGIIGSVILAESFTKPILIMNEQVEKLAGGEFDVTVTVKRDDEYGELAKSFNDLAATLREYRDVVQKNETELENKVAERTNALQKAFEELKKLDQMKDNLISSVSHELRTPLTSIKSYSQLLMDGVLGPVSRKQKNAMKISISSTNHLMNLVNNILESARFEAGKASFNFERFSMQKLLKKVLVEFQPTFKSLNAKVQLHCSDEVFVYADEEKLGEVLRNLISNSIKYRSRRRLSLYLHVTPVKNKIKISVTDNGIGIPKDGMKDLFNKFYQVDQGTTRKADGTGLGLSIVKQIVEAHDGSVQMSSEPEVGTEILITLPLIREMLSPDAPMLKSRPKFGKPSKRKRNKNRKK
ncbi:HAMP domain-containing protein [Candidatus Woesearchaeota archaeon]|nr:HAMP domain-containing protein [Candidatus Woesearchaeota archaeon]